MIITELKALKGTKCSPRGPAHVFLIWVIKKVN